MTKRFWAISAASILTPGVLAVVVTVALQWAGVTIPPVVALLGGLVFGGVAWPVAFYALGGWDELDRCISRGL